MGGVDFYVTSGSEEGEDDIEHLLPVAFVVDVVAVGNDIEEGLKESERRVDVMVFHRHVILANDGVGTANGAYVVGHERLHRRNR